MQLVESGSMRIIKRRSSTHALPEATRSSSSSTRIFSLSKGVLYRASNVDYSVEDGKLIIIYPEGTAGVVVYGLGVWGEWLRVMTVTAVLDKPIDFRAELLQRRGSFMYGRIVRPTACGGDKARTRDVVGERPVRHDTTPVAILSRGPV